MPLSQPRGGRNEPADGVHKEPPQKYKLNLSKLDHVGNFVQGKYLLDTLVRNHSNGLK